MSTLDAVRQHLDAFLALKRQGPFDYRWVHTHEGGAHDRTVVFQAITHGDEVGSLPAMLQVMGDLLEGRLQFGGRAHFVLGNPEASLQGTRFVERDLNRVFVDHPPDSHEGRRSRVLMPILDQGELFIDFHQTSQPAARPFYSYPWRDDWAAWTQALGGDTAWTTRPASAIFEPGMRCTDEYVRDKGGMGITLELGQRGFTQMAALRAREEMLTAMSLLDGLAAGATTVAQAASLRPAPSCYAVVHVEPFAHPAMALAPGWGSFRPLAAGQPLGAPGAPELVAASDGEMLFPVYPDRTPEGLAREPRPQTLFRIIRAVTEDPAVAFAP
jgi:succinylglutamate desuccinylase